MRFALGQTIYYLRNNKLHSGIVLSRMLVENANEKTNTQEQEQFFKQFGNSVELYATCHGIISPEEAFTTREDLIDFLFDAS